MEEIIVNFLFLYLHIYFTASTTQSIQGRDYKYTINGLLPLPLSS